MELKPKITDKNGRDVNGRFKNGNQGKPKGATNKTTKDLKQFVTNFLNDKAFEIPLIWDSLDDKDKAILFLHLSRLVMPRNEVNETDHETLENKSITVEIITPEIALELANELDEMY